MKDNTKNIQDIMDDVMNDIISSRNEMVTPEPKIEKSEKVEKVESLDDLMRGWTESTAALNTRPQERKTRLVWNGSNSATIGKKEDVYPFFTKRIITGPYLQVILENVFSVPHEEACAIEADLTKKGLTSIHISLREKLEMEVDLWNRVIATCEANKIDGVFYEDAHGILRHRLSDLNLMNQRADQRELGIGENVVRQTCKGKKYR